MPTRIPVETHAHWFGPTKQPVMGWLSTTQSCNKRSGVLLLPPIGYEYWTTHRSLRALAENLAQAGHLVFRLDYRGTGDAIGNQWEEGIVASWMADIQTGVQALRDQGALSIALVGLRLGATLGLMTAHEVGADAVVAWVPVTTGRRYVREIHLMSTSGPDIVQPAAGPGSRFLAGCVFSEAMLADLASLSAEDARTSARVLVLDRHDRAPSKRLIDALASSGATVQHVVVEGADSMLDQPTEYATVPCRHLSTIVDWLSIAGSAGAMVPPSLESQSGQPTIGGTPIIEREVILGEYRLLGIESRPTRGPVTATVVFLNSGSEHHVGPGRAWVELSRRLAAAGHSAIRVNFRGWGESPDGGYAPGRPYDPHTVDDTRSIVTALHERGDRAIVMVGLCAGAWIALRQCQGIPLSGMVLFNPQLYWQPGDPVLATIPEAIAWRQTETQSNPARVETERLAVKIWLNEICLAPYPIDFWFAREDPGILNLQNVLESTSLVGRSIGSLTIRELPNLDHAMHSFWHRAEAYQALIGMLQRITSSG